MSLNSDLDKSVSWLDTPVKIKEGKNVRARAGKTVIYPIFGLAAALTKDPFWDSLLTKASFGKFPKGYGYRDGFISFRKGNRSLKEPIPDEPELALDQICLFMKRTTGIRSDLDLELERQTTKEENTRDKPISECSWSELKKRKHSDHVMKEFIDVLTQKYSLNSSERDRLITVLTLGSILKEYGSESIQVQNGKIVEIRGLTFNSETRQFSFGHSSNSRHSRGIKIIKEPILSVSELKKITIQPKRTNLLETWRNYCWNLPTPNASSRERNSIESRDEESSEI
jgi:hypothetical protein